MNRVITVTLADFPPRLNVDAFQAEIRHVGRKITTVKLDDNGARASRTP